MVGKLGADFLGYARGFGTKDEDVSRLVLGVAVACLGAAGVDVDALSGEDVLDGGEAWVADEGDVGPVVETGPAEVAVVEIESQWLDEVEGGAGCGAESGDRAGVGGDFRVYQDDMELAIFRATPARVDRADNDARHGADLTGGGRRGCAPPWRGAVGAVSGLVST